MKTHYTIPIFIPEKACRFRCIYCNQFHITGQGRALSQAEMLQTIQQYLRTFPADAVKKIAFFGGTFTGMSIAEQNHYLSAALPFIRSGEIAEIQLSTRPDAITPEILDNLAAFGVGTIELGAQSLNEEVLHFSGRGHTVACVERASELIRSYGFSLGLQLMIGLPHDTKERSLQTAQRIVELGASCTRIYPTLVIRDTPLARLYAEGKYQPLSLDDAVDWSLDILQLFEKENVKVLRMGLHPSEDLRNGTQLLAGPFHISFKELVLSERWRRKLIDLAKVTTGDHFELSVPAAELNAAIGYNAANRKMLEQRFRYVKIRAMDESTVR